MKPFSVHAAVLQITAHAAVQNPKDVGTVRLEVASCQ